MAGAAAGRWPGAEGPLIRHPSGDTFSRKGRRGLEADGFEDAAENAVGIGHVLIGEAQDAEALAHEPGVAHGVTLGIVEGPVQLHDQPVTQAQEVRHIGPERNLTPELEAAEAAVAQKLPELAFRGRPGRCAGGREHG